MLNEKQLKVVFAKDPFIFLLAGAGTGKTTVIINKIKTLIKDNVKPENILVLSFTRKSVKDLKTKLIDIDNLLITTFHGFCYQALKDLTTINIISINTLISNGYSKDQLTKIDFYKRNYKEPKIVKRYNNFLKANNAYDYTDLEQIMVNKLKTDKGFKKSIKSKYKYIFIDEFQDTSLVQYKLLKEILSINSNCLCVGDPNQSIYSFRGASLKIIHKYIKNYKAKVYLLDINYRSGKDILKGSNKLLKYNPSSFKFNLVPFNLEAGVIVYKEFKDHLEKNTYIVNEIRRLLDLSFFQEEIAIIYRNHHFANELKIELEKTYFERLNFLTIHQVKGLEFDCVFFIGLEEEKLPFINANILEERRLFYVGITRAKKRLYLLCRNKKRASRFIFETIGK